MAREILPIRITKLVIDPQLLPENYMCDCCAAVGA